MKIVPLAVLASGGLAAQANELGRATAAGVPFGGERFVADLSRAQEDPYGRSARDAMQRPVEAWWPEMGNCPSGPRS